MPCLLCHGGPSWMTAAVRDHPLRTPYGVDNMPRLLSHWRSSRIAAAVRDHPLRTPDGVENLPRLPCAIARREPSAMHYESYARVLYMVCHVYVYDSCAAVSRRVPHAGA
eukprot:9084644-Pyramimonas_sp.AAC.1